MPWVLTTEFNDYDQHGEYFVAVFESKPAAEQLRPLITDWFSGPDIDTAELLLQNGGGRQKVEYQWFNLREEDWS